MSTDKIIGRVVRIIKKHLSGDRRIFLFGSMAKGNALDTSDVDIGILGRKKIPVSAMVKIKEEVEKIKTLRKVDVVDLKSMSRIFRDAAIMSGKVLKNDGNP